MTVHNSSNGKIGQSPRVPAFARETKMKNMRRGHVSAIRVREGVQRMCFSQKSDLFFRFEKLGVRRKSPVSPAAFSTPFHAGGPHRDAARAPAQAHSRSSRPGEALHVEPAQGRRQDRRSGRSFRERKTSNHRAGSGFVRSRAQPPRRRRPGRCEVRPARRDLSPDRGAKTRPRGTSVPSFRTRRRFTLARRTPRAHIPSPAFAPFFPRRGENPPS